MPASDSCPSKCPSVSMSMAQLSYSDPDLLKSSSTRAFRSSLSIAASTDFEMAEVLKFVDPRCLNLSPEGSDPPKHDFEALSKLETPQDSPRTSRKRSLSTSNSSWSGSESLYLSPASDLSTAYIAAQDLPYDTPTAETPIFVHTQSSQELLNFQSESHTSLAEECLSPTRKVRGEIVALYFRHVHAIFPIIDEYSFRAAYYEFKKEEELLKHIDLLLLQAVIFAGFAHINEEQLEKTPYSSVHQGQEAQFTKLKTLYRLRTTTDPYTLAQVSILASLWSPCDSEFQVNSYWVARAFHHAEEDIHLPPAQQRDSETLRCRRNLLWWCCLIRERMLTIGMRRPNRLCHEGYTRKLPTERDFGLEVLFSTDSTARLKRQQVVMFVLLCKLSDIMEEIALFQRNITFFRDWSVETQRISKEEVRQVIKLEQELKSWRAELDRVTVDRVQRRTKRSRIPFIYILRIMSDSLLASLHRPYLCQSLRSPEISAQFSTSPLELVKSSSRGVAHNLNKLLALNKLEGIPSYLMAWIALPTAVDYVIQYICDGSSHDNGLKDFLLNLRSRYQSARFICLLLEEAIKKPPTESADNKEAAFFDLLYYALEQPASEGLYLCEKDAIPRPAEAEMLDRVANFIDVGLANDIKGLSIVDS